MQELGESSEERSTSATHPTTKVHMEQPAFPSSIQIPPTLFPPINITQQAGEEDASPLVRISWAEYTTFPQILTAIKLIAFPWVADAGSLIVQGCPRIRAPCMQDGISQLKLFRHIICS